MVRKFIVLGQPRSGTTMAASAIAQHPEVRCYFELMHAVPEIRRKRHWISRSGRSVYDPPIYVVPDDRVVYQDGEDGGAFLRSVLFDRSWPAEIRAVGFKIHHVQARMSTAAFRAWSMLIADRDIAVVRIVRRNNLASYLSMLKAQKTGVWNSWRDGGENRYVAADVELSPDDCAKYFAAQARWYTWGRDVFRDHPSIDIEYESDLARDYSGTLNRIFDFLGLPAAPIVEKTRKLEQKTLRSQIKNFEALAEKFRDTPWRSYFDE